MYSFRISFCTVPESFVEVGALPLGHRDVERQQNRRGGIDGHRSGNCAERNAVEQRLHILERADGHADFAHFAARAGMIGIEAHLRGQIERHRKPGLALSPADSGSVHSIAPRCRIRRIAAWSRACRDTSSDKCRA